MMTDGVNISGITCDSRKVKQGYAFVAIKGSKYDGNDYIDMAIKNGAVIVYTEKNIINKTVPVKRVNNTRVKLAELLNEFYDFPSEKVKLIGVTGTNGKTTTTYLVENIFRKAGYRTGIIGTLGVKIEGEYLPSSLTTPEPEILFSLLDQMAKEKVEVVIMEVSSHGLKFDRTYGLEFDIAIHTNISQDHMDFHKSYDDYFQSKKKLFDSLTRNKIAILNIDDNNATRLVENNDKVLVISYGLSKKSSITASSLNIKNNIEFTLCIQRGITSIYGKEIEHAEYPITLNINGKHNVYNSLAAICAALSFGIDIEDIKKALVDFSGIDRRLEKIHDDNFIVIDDFCHNPASYEAVFETVQAMDYNNIIIVNAIRGNRGIKINEDNAKTISAWVPILGVKKVILSLSNDIVTEKDEVSNEEITTYKMNFDDLNVNYEICESLNKSINEVLRIVGNNDIILLLGAQGMDKGKEIFNNILELYLKNIG